MKLAAVQLVVSPIARRQTTLIPLAAEMADIRFGSHWKASWRPIRFQQLLLIVTAVIALPSASTAASGTATPSSAVRARQASTGDVVSSVNEHWLRVPPAAVVASTVSEVERAGDRRSVDVRMDRGREYVSGEDVMSDAAAALPEEDPSTVGRASAAVKSQCQYPCSCQKDPPRCKMGTTIKDGCNCCHICPRQQGDLCDHKFKCDEDRGLYCELSLDDGHRGICRAKTPKSCEVDNKTYKDGEEVRTCSQLCTCQNGQYACASLCPQEDRPPSKTHCRDAQLVTIIGQCCREWVCPHAHSLPQPDDVDPLGPAGFPAVAGTERCIKESTEWSPCSVTCGMGISTRLTNNNKDCQSRQERQLCLIRPCNLDDKHITMASIDRSVSKFQLLCRRYLIGQRQIKTENDCRSTWRDRDLAVNLEYGECTSVDTYKPKFCTTCKKNKCCGPGRTKSRAVAFSCPDGKRITEQFMWISSCECKASKTCPYTVVYDDGIGRI